MKNTKWLWWTLTILLTLIVLAGVGAASFRLGVAQGANLSSTDRPALTFHQWHGFDREMPRDGFGMRGFDHAREFGGRGFNRGGFTLFSPFFFLLRVAFFGGLIWLAYTLIKRSGWRLVKNEVGPAPVQTVAEEMPSGEGDEKKESA